MSDPEEVPGVGGPEAVPDITVELDDRRPIFLESTLGGAVSGLCFPLAVVAGGISLTAVGFPLVLDATTAAHQWAFHLVFAAVFGSLFGLLVDSRPLWMYGRGFLGPLVGAGYGALLWLGTNVVFWPLLVEVLGIPLGLGTAAPVGLSVGSHLAYGALVGSFLNLFALARI